MIFPPESIETSRRELAARLASGEILPAEAFASMLESDPDNRIALFELAQLRQEGGNTAEAERLAWKGLAAHPCDYRFYVQLAGLMAANGGDTAIAAGLMELGVLKLIGDPDLFDEAENLRHKGKLAGGTGSFDSLESLEALASTLAEQREHEPPEVSEELRPWRHLHELQEALGNELDRELVDAIVADGERCRPLLTGVLRGLAGSYLPDGGDLMGEAALALLGEIGDPESLLDLVQFAVLDDKGLSDIASWALLRIASRKPQESLQELGRFDRTTGGTERACIAETAATMPAAAGKADLLRSLIEGFEAVDENERLETLVVICAALLSQVGKPAVPVIRKMLTETSALLPPEAGSEVDDLLKAYAKDPSLFAMAGEESVPTVYDICCADRIEAYEEDDEDEDEEDEEDHVHGPGCGHDHGPATRPSGPGRNDPCWCGSGRKYKKCHLAEDEAKRLGTSAAE